MLKYTILVIEDDPDILSLYNYFFKEIFSDDINYYTVPDPDKAINIYNQLTDSVCEPDLIILDENLVSGTHGSSFLKDLKHGSVASPILVVSSDLSDDFRSRLDELIKINAFNLIISSKKEFIHDMWPIAMTKSNKRDKFINKFILYKFCCRLNNITINDDESIMINPENCIGSCISSYLCPNHVTSDSV